MYCIFFFLFAFRKKFNYKYINIYVNEKSEILIEQNIPNEYRLNDSCFGEKSRNG